MTINEAVEMVDRLKPNHYDHEQKVKWLSKLDGMIFREVISTHDGNDMEEFTGYDTSHPDRELIVGFPYDDDVYNYFLQMQIDKENGEIQKYNQTSALFNTAYKTFCDWYNRTHLPIPERAQFKF